MKAGDNFWDEEEKSRMIGDKKYRLTVAAIVYCGAGDQFLLLHRKLRWSGYELLKGGVKSGEELMEAAKRELREETGISDYVYIEDTGIEVDYLFPASLANDRRNNHRYDGAIQHFFLVKAAYKDVILGGQEHDGYIWARPGVVEDYLAHQNQISAFRKTLKMVPELNKRMPQ